MPSNAVAQPEIAELIRLVRTGQYEILLRQLCRPDLARSEQAVTATAICHMNFTEEPVIVEFGPLLARRRDADIDIGSEQGVNNVAPAGHIYENFDQWIALVEVAEQLIQNRIDEVADNTDAETALHRLIQAGNRLGKIPDLLAQLLAYFREATPLFAQHESGRPSSAELA